MRNLTRWAFTALLVTLLVATLAVASPDDRTTITVTQFIDDLRDILDDTDPSGGGYNWGDDEFLRWINTGRRVLATRAQCFQASTSINLVADTSRYDITGSLKNIAIVWAFYVESSKYYGLKRANPLTMGNAIEELAAATTPLYFVELPGEVAILPALESVTDESVSLIIAQMPDDLTTTADALDMPLSCLEALKYYVLHHAMMKDKQNARAGLYMQMFENEAQRLLSLFSGQPLGNEEIVTR